MVEKPSLLEHGMDPTNVTRWKHDVGFHKRGTQWDSPMARWAGEGNDWMKLVAQQHPRKEDVIHSLFASMRQAVEKKTKANETSLELEIPEEGKKRTLEIKGDCKTIVDWVNGHAKLKTRKSNVATTKNFLR